MKSRLQAKFMETPVESKRKQFEDAAELVFTKRNSEEPWLRLQCPESGIAGKVGQGLSSYAHCTPGLFLAEFADEAIRDTENLATGFLLIQLFVYYTKYGPIMRFTFCLRPRRRWLNDPGCNFPFTETGILFLIGPPSEACPVQMLQGESSSCIYPKT